MATRGAPVVCYFSDGSHAVANGKKVRWLRGNQRLSSFRLDKHKVNRLMAWFDSDGCPTLAMRLNTSTLEIRRWSDSSSGVWEKQPLFGALAAWMDGWDFAIGVEGTTQILLETRGAGPPWMRRWCVVDYRDITGTFHPILPETSSPSYTHFAHHDVENRTFYFKVKTDQQWRAVQRVQYTVVQNSVQTVGLPSEWCPPGVCGFITLAGSDMLCVSAKVHTAEIFQTRGPKGVPWNGPQDVVQTCSSSKAISRRHSVARFDLGSSHLGHASPVGDGRNILWILDTATVVLLSPTKSLYPPYVASLIDCSFTPFFGLHGAQQNPKDGSFLLFGSQQTLWDPTRETQIWTPRQDCFPFCSFFVFAAHAQRLFFKRYATLVGCCALTLVHAEMPRGDSGKTSPGECRETIQRFQPFLPPDLYEHLQNLTRAFCVLDKKIKKQR